jgi:hypothetical protein
MELVKIKATKEQLESVGIDYEITNLTGSVERKFSSGYYCIKIKHTWEGIEFENEFDIPKYWLELQN